MLHNCTFNLNWLPVESLLKFLQDFHKTSLIKSFLNMTVTFLMMKTMLLLIPNTRIRIIPFSYFYIHDAMSNFL